MSAEGGGDRGTSTPEETAGVEEFDRTFEWTPRGRPCHPVAYLIEALPYAAYGVFLVAVIAFGLWSSAMLAGPAMELAGGAVDDIELNPFGGEGEAEADPASATPTETVTQTGTETETRTETAIPTATATATPTPSPSPSPTVTATPTPTSQSTTSGGNGGRGGGGISTATATATLTPTPTPTPSPTPEPADANFAVTVDSTNSPVTEGETLDVTATVENTGEKDGTQTVSLDVGGTERDSTEVSLAGGESQTVALSWTTGEGDAGDYTATVGSADDSDSVGVTVEQPEPTVTQFQVDDNTECGGIFNEDQVEFAVSWDTEDADSVTVTLPDGSTEHGKSGSTTYSDSNGNCGDEYTFEIVAENDAGSDSETVTKTAG